MFEEHAVKILIFSIVFIPLVNILNYRFRQLAKLLWFGKVILTFLVLTTSEIILVDWLAETAYISYVKIGFDMLWWLVPAYLINLAMEIFVWTPLEEKTGRLIPNLIRLFAAEMVYALAVLGIIIFISESPILALIVLLQLIVIFGFFIKKALPDLIINIVRPFRIGDWVKIGEFEEGEVIDIEEQTTFIKTRDSCEISIPSRTVLQSPIKNFCYPDKVYWSDIKIKVDAVHPPKRVRKVLLDAVLSADNILKEPESVVLISDMSNDTVEYTVSYCSDNYAGKLFVKENVFIRIWFHLGQAGIPLAIEPQSN